MAVQYLAEGLKGAVPFIADKARIVTESLPGGGTRTRIPGRISLCDTLNGNGRRYGRRVWEKNLSENSVLMQSIRRSAAFGLLEHPADGKVDWRSPISHLLTDAKLQRGTDKDGKEIWEVVGEIQVIDGPGFPDGQRLRTLIETTNYNPLVSTRGFGSLVRAPDGADDVQDDYVCEGADVVMKPSFETAELHPRRESIATEAASPAALSSPVKTLSETVAPAPGPAAATVPVPPAATVPAAPAAPAPQPTLEAERGSRPSTSPVQTPPQEKSMNLNELKQAMVPFKSMDPSKLAPQQFAEGMSQLGALHQEVANFVAEDAKRQWQGQQLHNEIAAIESSWNESQLVPGKRANALREDNTKLMQVVKAVAETGLTFKKKLGESVSQSRRQTALLNEVVNRGQGWRQRAKALESQSAKYRRRFLMASEALQGLAGKYKHDVVALGKRVIQLEFKEKAETPKIQSLLKEAVKPKQLVEIRNILEGKTTLPSARAAGQGAAPSLTEGKRNSAAPPAAGNPNAPVSEGVTTILSPKPNDPREISEAIGMVTRLSKAMA
jgi:hypothetical protein